MKELKEEVRLQELTTPTASQLASLRRAAAKAATDHRIAIEARIRGEIAPDREVGERNGVSKPAATRQTSPTPMGAESAAADRKREAELRLHDAELRLQKTDAGRTELRAAQARLNSVTSMLSKEDSHAGQDTGATAANLEALPPERVQIVERRDHRAFWATAAGLGTAVVLGLLLYQFWRGRRHGGYVKPALSA